MKINSVGYYPIQPKQQVGFGMSLLRLDREVKNAVKTKEDALKLLRLAKILANDGKNYVITIMKTRFEERIFGSVCDNQRFVSEAAPIVTRGKVLKG